MVVSVWRNGFPKIFICFVGVLVGISGLSAVSSSGAILQAPSGAFAAVGAQANRGYFSGLPVGTVDMVNGDLTIAVPGLALPGNNGMDVRIRASFRQQTWQLGFTDVAVAVYPGVDVPVLGLTDGSQKKLFANVVPNLLITTDFWKYDPVIRKLYLPDGRIASFQEYPPQAPATVPYLRLSKIEDPFGNEIRAFWTGFAALELDYLDQAVAGTNGTQVRTIDFSVSSDGLTRTVTYGNKTWTYTPQSVTPPTGPAWTFVRTDFEDFNDKSGTLTVTTPTGGTVAFTFGATGLDESTRSRLESVTTGGRAVLGGTWNFTFDGLGSQTSQVTTPSGRTITYVHDFYDGPNGTDWMLKSQTVAQGGDSSTIEWTYDDAPFLSSPAKAVKVPVTQAIVQDGVTYTTAYEYGGGAFKDYRRPWRISESASDHALTRVTTTTFDYSFSRYLVNRISGQTVTLDGESFTATSEYDDTTGALTQATQLGLTSTFGQDAGGNTNLTTDPMNHQTLAEYQWGVPSSATGAGPAVSRAVNPDGTFESESIGGVTTTFSYDPIGRVTLVTPPEGAATTTSYAGDGTSVTVTTSGSAVTTYVDGFGRPTLVEDSAGVKVATVYDNEGRKTFESHPWTGGGGGPGTEFSYDFLGRVKRITHADNTFVQYGYGASQLEVTDENGHRTIQYFQAFGSPGNARVVALRDQANKLWQYSYNALGSLTRVATQGAVDRVWVHDANNRLISETHPESGTATFTYNADGLIESKTTGLGTVWFTYYPDHSLFTINHPGTADDTTFSYDNRGNRTGAVLGNGNETRFTYDALNQLRSREERVNGQIFISQFDYDPRGNLWRITYPSGRVVMYDYDSADRMTKVYSDTQIYAQNIQYHASGAIAGLAFGNGLARSLTLDNRGRPRDWTNGPLQITYEFNGGGNVTSIADARGHSSIYSYDERDRLRVVTGQGANEYTYDDFGNRLTKAFPAVSYTYDAANRLTSASGPFGAPETGGTLLYDAVGNMTADGQGSTFGYSARSLMTSATVAGKTTAYTYDADGLRVMKSSPGGNQYFAYGLGSQLLAEYSSLFSKTAPVSGSSGSSPSVTVQWSGLAGATFEVCVDTTQNAVCDTSWVSSSTATHSVLTGCHLEPTTGRCGRRPGRARRKRTTSSGGVSVWVRAGSERSAPPPVSAVCRVTSPCSGVRCPTPATGSAGTPRTTRRATRTGIRRAARACGWAG